MIHFVVPSHAYLCVSALHTLLPEDSPPRERLSYERGRSSSHRRVLLECFASFCLLAFLPPTLTLPLTPSPSIFMTLIVQHDLPQAQMAQNGRDTAGKSNTGTGITMTPDSNPQVLYCLGCLEHLTVVDLSSDAIHICSVRPGGSFLVCFYADPSTSNRADARIVYRIQRLH